MLELVAESPLLRLLLLVLLFAIVAAVVYFVTHAVGLRQVARHRLFETAPATSGNQTLGSLRAERVESAWLKLVNTIESRGLSLVDTKDAALRQKMIAASYPVPH